MSAFDIDIANDMMNSEVCNYHKYSKAPPIPFTTSSVCGSLIIIHPFHDTLFFSKFKQKHTFYSAWIEVLLLVSILMTRSHGVRPRVLKLGNTRTAMEHQKCAQTFWFTPRALYIKLNSDYVFDMIPGDHCLSERSSAKRSRKNSESRNAKSGRKRIFPVGCRCFAIFRAIKLPRSSTLSKVSVREGIVIPPPAFSS